MTIYIIDTETTGLTSKDEVIHLATIKIPHTRKELFKSNFLDLPITSEYYRPNVAIHPKAQEVHGIGRLRLMDKPNSLTVKLPSDIKYLIAHNAVFDTRMLANMNETNKEILGKIKIICTLTIAKRLKVVLPDIFKPSDNKLRTIYKFLYPDSIIAGAYHDATEDCIMCGAIIKYVYEQFAYITNMDELYASFYLD